MVRFALAALCLAAGCVIQPNTGDDTYYPPPDNGGWGSGYGGGGGASGYGCHADSECPTGFICARNGECLGPSSVRIIHVNWTVNARAASDATCAATPNLDLTFRDANSDLFGFSPVPCKAGRFTIDKMPFRFTSVTLARAGDLSGGATGSFNTSGDANLDLPY